MTSGLPPPSPRLQSDCDLVRVRQLLGWQAVKFEGRIRCKTVLLDGLWPDEIVTLSFKIKIRCSSYVCPGSSCHTYGQNVNTKNYCLGYVNFIT
jgi:hypothetical protein